ncbi:MAG: cytochrome c oxidase assembly protein [Proteobacteria bacterium]|nr:cytochrome c oxidase assembly protein [Pseudomonadota bacterium]
MQAATRTAKKLTLVAIAMFGFGYALVPLYDVFCDITGINGKTGEISQAEADSATVDTNRLITVEFDTNVNSALPWKFKAAEYKMKVHPGEIAEAVFIAENQSDTAIAGRAVPSVAPAKASLFFNKTECFCFTRQVLEPGESKEMVVRFVVDSDLPEKISTMTLSYTFFDALDGEEETVTVNTIGANNSKG